MDELKNLGAMAREALKPMGLEVGGLHYYNFRLPQKRTRGMAISFDAETHNPHFFGRSYQNSKRIGVMDTLYQKLGGALDKAFPGQETCLDAYVDLKEPRIEIPPALNDGPELRPEFVDVMADQNVRLVGIRNAIRNGEVSEGSMLDYYCKTYSIPVVLKHGWHFISPDSASVEALEAICSTRKISSVLEIGAGVGICGEAAERRGIRNFTFVDASKTVCAYLRHRFPCYRTVHCDAFDFDPNKQYDLALMGLPYELNPHFLQKNGRSLASHAETVVFQSGIKAFFEFEHDWIAGKPRVANWPWWRCTQVLENYFYYVFEMAFDWQLCLVGTHDRELARSYKKAMMQRGFDSYLSPYNHLKI